MKKHKKLIIIPLLSILVIFVVYFASALIANYKLGLTKVVVAKMSLPQRTKINEDLLDYIYVPKEYINENTYLSKEDVINKYVKLNCYIPAGCIFYKGFLEDENSIKDRPHLSLKENEITYDLFVKDIKVNPAHLLSGMSVDIYLTVNRKTIESDLLISGARIVGLYDINNNEIKTNNDNYTLGTISIALNKEMVPYLNKAIVIGDVSLLVSSDLYKEGNMFLNSSSKIFDLVS